MSTVSQATAPPDASPSGGAISFEADLEEALGTATTAQTIGGGSLREEADDYAAVLVRIGPELRVVACGQGLQWIVQRRRIPTKPRVGGRCVAVGYRATRKGLIQVSHALSAPEGPALWAWAMEQPPHFRAEQHVDGCVPTGKRD
jgi:hypothetical protein